ncbi:cyclic nucleotide-binding domain-containing protein [Lactococcus carnosus]|uniref:cyclic nucleotide-binding domain-containing protein n=2 Tax=Pseudolactococcus carnosus TaxID=2749961 RepID=UPI000812A62E|nr:cyclic nucleotide-binding domain-containing protein [Lactococcus carnosus]SCA92883.1 conserved hypothetical protein, cyclic nucleotide-binding domain [Lactococcus piscium]MCJ1969132.1 cyclic nucleotide-binding domain-containing protein [Lactococcus carnosus]MCJ1974962.1 cyclic nucleotide-binding domain-containing protein [Lactococcus carnosus]MCJ1985207.1 cyclic nucleotide-binding domain-containing protein [Lactococcus carnosus]MCJ1986659.1 cyclic nucleotide-binding domain-containing protei
MKKIKFNQETAANIYNAALPFDQHILSVSYLMTYGNKEWIQHASNSIDYLYLLLDGKAKLVKGGENGKQAILQFLYPGDFIGELTLVGAEKTTKDIISIGNSVCLAIPMFYAEKHLLTDNAFLRMISQYTGTKLLERTERAIHSQLYEFKYRLAELLLTITVDDYYQEKHTEMAEYLGVSYRHLLYTFQHFRDQGLIDKGKKIKINRTKLSYFLEERMQ